MSRPKTLRDGGSRLAAVVKALWPELLRERRLAAGALVAIGVSTVLRTLEPWPLKVVVDGLTRPPSAAGSPGSQDVSSTLILAAAAVVVVTGLRALFDYLRTVGFALVSNRVLGRVRTQLYQRLQRLSLSFHDRARGGDLLVRVTGDVKTLGDVAVTALLPLVASGLLLATMTAVMLVMNARLTLIAVAVLPLSALTTVRLSRRIHAAARKQRTRESRMASSAAQALTAMKVVQALSLESHFEDDFAIGHREDIREGARSQRLAARLERSMDLLIALATALVLWAGGRMVLRAELTVGELVVFLTYLKRGMQPLQDFAKYSSRLAKAVAAGERVVDILRQSPDVVERPDAVTAYPCSTAIAFEQVSFAYAPGAEIFRGLDLVIPAGSRIALVGGSGSGKSTLISLLLRLYDVSGGRVALDGRDIRDFTLGSLRRQFGVVLQDSVLFAATVAENIALGAGDATREQIMEAAQLAGAHAFITRLPASYDTPLGERGVNLSHGQRQRIALARAALRQAPVLLLDEPTAGLDQRNERLVSEAIDRLSVGRTTLLATHDMRRAAACDEIVVLESGRIVERGTHALLIEANGVYATLHRLQAKFPGGHERASQTHVPAC